MGSEFEKAMMELGEVFKEAFSKLNPGLTDCQKVNITTPEDVNSIGGDTHEDKYVELEVSWNTYDMLIGKSFRLGQSIDTVIRDACLEYKLKEVNNNGSNNRTS